MVRKAADALVLASALTARERRLQSGGGEPVDGTNQLSALEEAVSALDAAGIRCVLIGGLAVGVRAGIPRATMDVDLAVATVIPRDRVTEILSGAGFELRGEHAHSINFHHRTGEPLQVAFDPGFDGVIDRAEPVRIGDVDIPVAQRSDLIVMKQRAAADPARRRSQALRDLADVELLQGDVPSDDEGW